MRGYEEFKAEIEEVNGVRRGEVLCCVGGPRRKGRKWFVGKYGGDKIVIEDIEKSNYYVDLGNGAGYQTGPNIFMSGPWAYCVRAENGRRFYLSVEDLKYFKKEGECEGVE